MTRLIDADALIENFGRPEDDRDRAINHIIDKAPTVDPVRHAHWKATFAGMAICSACDEDQEVETFVGNAVQKYCARCGARMDAEGEKDG